MKDLKIKALAKHLEIPIYMVGEYKCEGLTFGSIGSKDLYLVLTEDEASYQAFFKQTKIIGSALEEIEAKLGEELYGYFDENSYWENNKGTFSRGELLNKVDGNEYVISIENNIFYIYQII